MILQTFSIACLGNLKHLVPLCEDSPSTIRAQFLMG